jgi:hypothetical protein
MAEPSGEKPEGFTSQGELMPREESTAPDAAETKTSEAATAVAELPKPTAPSMTRPAYIDGPRVRPNGEIIKAKRPKNWSEPYQAIVTGSGFEMGEDREFNERVFKFRDKPSDTVLAALKQNGFTYRPKERVWTIQANPDSRKLSDELARQFAGPAAGQRL